MPLQYQILNMLSEVSQTAHRTEGKLDALSSRVDRMEDREHDRHSKETTARSGMFQTWTPRDFALSLAGLVMILLAAVGKLPWSLVVSLLGQAK